MMEKGQILRRAFPEQTRESVDNVYAEIGDVITALAWSDLFWPPCFEVRGVVIVGVNEKSPEWIEQRTIESDLERRATLSWSQKLASFNWFEIEYLFGNLGSPFELQGEAAFLLAQVLRQTWAARLTQLYPRREFELRIDEGTKDVGLSLSVCQ
jgi:hypothetical protein